MWLNESYSCVSLGYFVVNLSGGQPKMYWWFCRTGVEKSHEIAHICCQTQGQHIQWKTISLRWLCIDLELTPSEIMTSRETQEYTSVCIPLQKQSNIRILLSHSSEGKKHWSVNSIFFISGTITFSHSIGKKWSIGTSLLRGLDISPSPSNVKFTRIGRRFHSPSAKGVALYGK